jgi:hypothetical protein
MKRPSFFEGVTVAVVASLVAGACFAALTTLLPSGSVLRFIVAGLGLAYIIYLLSRNEERVGRITTIALWLVGAIALWLLQLPFPAFLCAHLGLVWLVRSLYFHSSLLTALADLGLVALGLAAAVWSATRSHSAALSVWCFFLVQALYVAIPARIAATGDKADKSVPEDRFHHAHQAAEAALRRIHSVR